MMRKLATTSTLTTGRRQLHVRSQQPEVVILSAARTPIASFQSSFASLTAPELGTIAIKEAIQRAQIKPEDINEVLLGNVVGAGVGQAPATQAAMKADIPFTTPTTTVNKVCASGMKTVMMGAQSIMTGHNNVVLAGGFESMSNIPYYLMKARSGYGLGNGEVVDGLIKDGLWDAFDNHHMGMCAEHCATTYQLSRQQQDDYALESYRLLKKLLKQDYLRKKLFLLLLNQRKVTLLLLMMKKFSNYKHQK